jgi:hypothetical protein
MKQNALSCHARSHDKGDEMSSEGYRPLDEILNDLASVTDCISSIAQDDNPDYGGLIDYQEELIREMNSHPDSK